MERRPTCLKMILCEPLAQVTDVGVIFASEHLRFQFISTTQNIAPSIFPFKSHSTDIRFEFIVTHVSWETHGTHFVRRGHVSTLFFLCISPLSTSISQYALFSFHGLSLIASVLLPNMYCETHFVNVTHACILRNRYFENVTHSKYYERNVSKYCESGSLEKVWLSHFSMLYRSSD